MIRLSDIKISIEKAADRDTERLVLIDMIFSQLKISEKELLGFEIFRKSVDARKKDKIFYVYTIDVNVSNEQRIIRRCGSNEIMITPSFPIEKPDIGSMVMRERPVIVGMGPAGLFAGLMLSRYGYQPVILERGDEVEARTKKVDRFWNNGSLDPDSNVQFGEGGAGTFSDGKLTTLINDRRCRMILEEFVKAGAPEEILYMNKPHIGTDKLKAIVKHMRQEIISYGGEVRFRAKVTDLKIKDGKITGVVVNDRETMQCGIVLLAAGHSARDTYEVLFNKGIEMERKAFSIGFRIEHPQIIIDRSQYGAYAGYPGLGAADYKLAYHSKSGRSAYTFCMCPGGYVTAAASEEQCVVTNGMSNNKRDGENANSALLVGITPADFGSDHPLSGIGFQRKCERHAFVLGGGDYHAPVQLTGDFLADRPSDGFGGVKPTYRPGVSFVQLKDCLPGFAIETLKEAIIFFDTRIRGFAMPDSLLTGVETRSSSPVRIKRNEDHMSNINGIYPSGEGAGYSGGIMSSAVDGIKTAEKIMARFAPVKRGTYAL